MAKQNILVVNEEGGGVRSTLGIFVITLFMLTLGIALGVLVPFRSLNLQNAIALIERARTQLLGATGTINEETTNEVSAITANEPLGTPDATPEASATETPAVTDSTADATASDEPPAPPPPVYMTLSVADLEQYILDQHSLVETLTRELTYTKEHSINVAALFSRNCNNWGDYCAGAYREELDTLNREYLRLTKLLEAANTDLTAAQNRSDLLQGL